MLKENKAYLLPHFKKAPIFFKTKSMIYVTLKNYICNANQLSKVLNWHMYYFVSNYILSHSLS